jgi:hypothetical protein
MSCIKECIKEWGQISTLYIHSNSDEKPKRIIDTFRRKARLSGKFALMIWRRIFFQRQRSFRCGGFGPFAGVLDDRM